MTQKTTVDSGLPLDVPELKLEDIIPSGSGAEAAYYRKGGRFGRVTEGDVHKAELAKDIFGMPETKEPESND